MDSIFDQRPTEAEEPVEPQAATPYEPFLQDWYPAPVERPASGALVLTNRQLAIIGFLGVVALALMAALAYVAGRVASSGPSRVLMVESAAPVARVEGAKPPSPELAAALQASPVAPQSSRQAGMDSIRGLAFWQVGALDKGMASVAEKYLLESGVPARLEPVAGSNMVRVLVGPAAGSELAALKEKLAGLGFPAVLKQY